LKNFHLRARSRKLTRIMAAVRKCTKALTQGSIL